MTKATNTKPAPKRSRNTVGKSDAELGATPTSAESDVSDAVLANAVHPAASAPAKPQSKTALVLDLLRRPDGASIDQLVEATGWLPHTTRAALTGLKKKGYVLTNDKVEGSARIYRVGIEPASLMGNSGDVAAETAA